MSPKRCSIELQQPLGLVSWWDALHQDGVFDGQTFGFGIDAHWTSYVGNERHVVRATLDQPLTNSHRHVLAVALFPFRDACRTETSMPPFSRVLLIASAPSTLIGGLATKAGGTMRGCASVPSHRAPAFRALSRAGLPPLSVDAIYALSCMPTLPPLILSARLNFRRAWCALFANTPRSTRSSNRISRSGNTATTPSSTIGPGGFTGAARFALQRR